MAHHKSAKKRIKQNEKRRQRNKAAISKIRTMMKNLFDLEDKEKAEVLLKETVKVLDKTAARGRLHRNNVARKKSQLTKHVNNLAVSAAE